MHTSVLFLIGLLFVICNLEYSDSFAESPSFKCNENVDRNSDGIPDKIEAKSSIDWSYCNLEGQDISKIDFDIALVSCGGYGLPICHYINNQLNKGSIYVGGILQIYFGIIGRRWLREEKYHIIRNTYNSNGRSSNTCLSPVYFSCKM